MPQKGKPFTVRGISLGAGVTVELLDRRQRLLNDLDTKFVSMQDRDSLITGLDRFSDKAYSMLTSERARQAFDISKESPSFAAQFGSDPFEQSCLLAIRLIESGVRFVSLSIGGWDNHTDIFNNLSKKLLPKLDGEVPSLLDHKQEFQTETGRPITLVRDGDVIPQLLG